MCRIWASMVFPIRHSRQTRQERLMKTKSSRLYPSLPKGVNQQQQLLRRGRKLIWAATPAMYYTFSLAGGDPAFCSIDGHQRRGRKLPPLSPHCDSDYNFPHLMSLLGAVRSNSISDACPPLALQSQTKARVMRRGWGKEGREGRKRERVI